MDAPETTRPQPRPGDADRTVTEAIVSFLLNTLGCDRLFTVPGEAVLPLVSLAGQAGVELVPTRHEAGAGFAAIADAWLTGRPGVVAVNRSPGAANVSIALDATRSDPTPVLVVMGAPRRGQDHRTGYQSADPETQLGGVAAVITVEDPRALPRCLDRVARLLNGAAPRAAVLVVPQDIWNDTVPSGHPRGQPVDSYANAPTSPGAGEQSSAETVAHAIKTAKYPVLVAGRLLRRHRKDGSPSGALDRFAERAGLPVLLGNKQQDLMDNEVSAYAGDLHQGTHPDTRARLARADVVVFLGALPCEVHLSGWYANQALITIHPEPAGPGRHIVAEPRKTLEALAAAAWPELPEERSEWLRGWGALERGLRDAAPTSASGGQSECRRSSRGLTLRFLSPQARAGGPRH